MGFALPPARVLMTPAPGITDDSRINGLFAVRGRVMDRRESPARILTGVKWMSNPVAGVIIDELIRRIVHYYLTIHCIQLYHPLEQRGEA